MKKILIIILLGWSILLPAAEHTLTVDVHGGTSYLLKAGGEWSPLAGLGVRYACLFPTAPQTKMGIALGAALSYAEVGYANTSDSVFSRWDAMQPANEIIYTISGGYKETYRQLRVQVPLLFEVHTHGLSLGVGAAGSMWQTIGYNEQFLQPTMSAYYPAYEVLIPDNDPAHLLTEDDWRRSLVIPERTWSVMVVGEVGYEWKLRLADAVGVQAFAQYAVWTTAVPVVELGLKVYYRFSLGTGGKHGCMCLKY